MNAGERRDPGDVLPVFPLPSAVLFPQTVLPLHVFEPRYRAMIQDVSGDGDGRIVLALLRPGFEADYAGSPGFYGVGTIGRIDSLVRLPDGRYTLDLVGLERADLAEIPSSKPYRLVRTTARPEVPADERDTEVQKAKVDLLASQGYLVREISGDGSAGIALDADVAFTTAVNGTCANLPSDPQVRQALLELDDMRARQRSVQDLINKVLGRVLELKATPDRSDSRLN